jgi:hypothetical protein
MITRTQIEKFVNVVFPTREGKKSLLKEIQLYDKETRKSHAVLSQAVKDWSNGMQETFQMVMEGSIKTNTKPNHLNLKGENLEAEGLRRERYS